jgi:hypothetical protein
MTPTKHSIIESLGKSYEERQQEKMREIEVIAEALKNAPAKIIPPAEHGKPPTQDPSQVIIPKNITAGDYFFLGGDLGKAINKKIQREYAGIEAITKVTYDKKLKVVTGSNSFYNIIVDMELKAQNVKTSDGKLIRLAAQSELEETLALGDILQIKGHYYADTGIVLRNAEEPNTYLAQDLMEKLKARNPKQKLPVFILLRGLALEKDPDSTYGLSFKLTDEAQILYAPILNSNSGSYFSSAEIDKNTGLPAKVHTTDVSKENRQLWTRDSGLSRLYLYRCLIVNSVNEDLAVSCGNGRVVLVSAEGANAQKI